MVIHAYTKRSVREGVNSEVMAMVDGMRRHGVNVEMRLVKDAERCDVAVMWGVKKAAIRTAASRSLILERGYVGDRFHFTSVGWDGLNGLAWRPEGMPGDRWGRYFADRMKPWREARGKYVLVMGQVPGDASLRGMDTHQWAFRVVQALKAARLEARVRRHLKDPTPSVRMSRRLADARRAYYETRPWEDALADAAWVVAYNSNSAVESVLDGVPTVTLDRGTMAYPVTDHDPVKAPTAHDRTQWAHDLAYAQWTIDEMASGDAWDYIKGGLDRG